MSSVSGKCWNVGLNDKSLLQRLKSSDTAIDGHTDTDEPTAEVNADLGKDECRQVTCSGKIKKEADCDEGITGN